MSKADLLGSNNDLAEKMKKLKEGMEAGEKKQDIEKISPKLFVTGRLDRKKEKYVAKSLAIPEWLDDEIKAYCRGVDLVILNYLIVAGLKHVKESETSINFDFTEIQP